MNRSITILSGIFIGVIILSLALMILNDNGQPNNKTSQKKVLNAYMLDTTYTQFNKQGQIHSVLSTPRADYYKAQDTSFFTTPNILIYTADRTPWRIHAMHGKSLGNNNRFKLWHDVKLRQLPRPNSPTTLITTSEMTVYPKKSFAKTNQPVTITRPGTVMHGIGASADFKTGLFKLLSHSRGYYVPKPTS